MIQLLHAAFVYQSPDGEVEALRDVSFDVQEGEFCSIVGPSGCGKSTLLSALAGLEPLTGGRVELKGEPVCGPSRKVGFMPQRDQLFEWRSIWSNVTLGLTVRGENTPQRQAHVRELLERYGLADFAQKRPSQLSGGMRQRCALIRTLAAQPKVLLLDEPFSALDYQTRLAVSADIYRIIRQEGKTALLVTHDISEAISLSDRVVVLSHRPAVVKSIHRLTQLQGCRPCSGGITRLSPGISSPSGRSWKCMKDSAPSPRRLQYLRDYRRRKRSIRLWQVCLLAGLFALWELTTRLGLSDGFLTSSPSRMAGTLQSLWHSGDLWRHIGTSCLETVVGFTAGTLLGTAIAVAMWWWEKLARVLDPYLVVLNALPKTALGPIFIVWMGAGMGAIIVMTLAISLIVTILTMYQGFMTTDPEKLRLMRSLGARRSQMLWLLVFPANCPTLFNTLKVNVGLSWVGVIMGEFLVSRAGLGYLIVYGSQVFNMDLVMTSVLILALAAVVMYQLVLRVEKILNRTWGVQS